MALWSNIHGIVKAAEIFNLCSKDEVPKLGKGQKDDEEHDSKSSQILSTASQSRGQLGHCFVKTDVFEHLQYKGIH